MKSSLLLAGVLMVAVSGTAQAQSTKPVTIVNGTHYAIFAVQSKVPGSAQWKPDLLKNNTLGVGQMRGVGVSAGDSCKCDFLATLDDGHKVLIPNVDICKNRALPVTDDRH